MDKLTGRTGAAYIRVSTNDQMELSPESQLKEILKYAQANGITVPEAYVFMEKEGRSGKRAGNRPEFQRMIATAKTRPRPFDVILVWKFSRFARNQDESTFYKGMLRKKLGINILSVSEPVLDGMYGRLIELIIEWQDEFYSYNLSAEVRRGMEQKALRGGYQSALPYGYRSSASGGIPAVAEDQAQAVKMIFSLCADRGKTSTEIAAILNEKGFCTGRGNPFEGRSVLYILENPFYTGKVRWNRAPHGSRRENPREEIFIADGRHEPLVSEELFNRAALVLALQKKVTPVRVPSSCRHFLSGLLKCPVCGSGLAFNGSGTGGFQCSRYAKGMHKGSAYLSERRILAALRQSLDAMGLGDIAAMTEDPGISVHKKRTVLWFLLQKIVYDRSTDTFRFYYRG